MLNGMSKLVCNNQIYQINKKIIMIQEQLIKFYKEYNKNNNLINKKIKNRKYIKLI